jgi:hypothetical protein
VALYNLHDVSHWAECVGFLGEVFNDAWSVMHIKKKYYFQFACYLTRGDCNFLCRYFMSTVLWSGKWRRLFSYVHIKRRFGGISAIIKFEQDSYYNSNRFLFICWWQFYVFSNNFKHENKSWFIEQKCHVFLLSLWLANKRIIHRIYTFPCMFCALSFSFEPKSRYSRSRHKQCPVGTDLRVLPTH